MVQRIGGFRRKTRQKLRKDIRSKGKISLTRYLQSFKIGEKVTLKAEPAVHKGMYYPRFHGRSGIIKDKRGESYLVSINDKGKEKSMYVHPVHIARI